MEYNLNNFGTMVWQENTHVIVMLTSAEEESQPRNIRYFPYNQDDTIFSDSIVKEDEIVSECNYTETVLNITHKMAGELRTVHHFKFQHWPEDQIVAVDKLLDVLLAVNEQNQEFLVEAVLNNQRIPGPIVFMEAKASKELLHFVQ